MSTTTTARAPEPTLSATGPILQLAPVFVALGLMLGAGLLHGRWTGRWAASSALRAAVQRLAALPRTVGDWEGRDGTVDSESLEMAEIAGYVVRHYRDRRTGRSVSVLLVCGRPGPIAVHSPEVCYGGSGYTTIGSRKRVSLGNGASAHDAFWAIELEKPAAVEPDRLRILYGWSADGQWNATDRPRYEFAGSDVLFKLYVIRHREGGADDAANDVPEQQFLEQFLPVLRETVFAVTASPKR